MSADHRPGGRFVKGHGTENDFVLLPDADGSAGPPSPDLVRALCDRRAGLGADGVIRVVRTAATDDPAAVASRDEAEWFMDYRNADGSLSEMCGNGVRVLARFLQLYEDVSFPLPVATRDGVKTLTLEADGELTADMGPATGRGETAVTVGDRTWPALHVDIGNPHAVAFVDDLADAGPLLAPPGVDTAVYPHGVNVEFVARRGPGHVAMRVHERGSGETRSCGTGACAVALAAALADGRGVGTGARGDQRSSYTVDVPGGRLRVRVEPDGRCFLTGPATLVAEGYWLAGR